MFFSVARLAHARVLLAYPNVGFPIMPPLARFANVFQITMRQSSNYD